ncbi:hypothetical protein CF319_g6158 [Tilletia indica]|nr:hypothetical protein CF319_g6158 [Tilletia indica]
MNKDTTQAHPSSDDFPSDFDEETLRSLEPYIGRVVVDTPSPHQPQQQQQQHPPQQQDIIPSATAALGEQGRSFGNVNTTQPVNPSSIWSPPSPSSSLFSSRDGDVTMSSVQNAAATGSPR